MGKKVHLVLDNARYQKCSIVQELANQLDIQLEYILPYSPNLNLIKWVWKFVKGEISSKYYDNFDAFKQKINRLIGQEGKIIQTKEWVPMGKSIANLYRYVEISRAITKRYLAAMPKIDTDKVPEKEITNLHFKWGFEKRPQGLCYCSPERRVPQAYILPRKTGIT